MGRGRGVALIKKQIIVLTHGLNATVEDAHWLNEVKSKLDQASDDHVEVLIHRWDTFAWGFITPVGRWISTIAPAVLSKRWRNNQVKGFQRYINWVRGTYELYEDDTFIDVVAHSFGCYKTHYSMTLDSKEPKAFYRKLIMIGAAVSSRVKYDDIKGHVKQEHFLWSSDDDVIAHSNFGNVGWKGPAFAKRDRIIGHEYPGFGHGDYFKEPNFRRIVKFLKQTLLT